MLFCEGFLNSCVVLFPWWREQGDAIFPPPTSMDRLQWATQHASVEAGATYTILLPTAPCVCIFIRASRSENQHSRPLTQKISTNQPPHALSLLIIEYYKASVLVERGSGLFYQQTKPHLFKMPHTGHGPNTSDCRQRETLQTTDRRAKAAKTSSRVHILKHFLKWQALDSIGPFLNITITFRSRKYKRIF